jgi:hypothetical protein
LEFHLYYPKPRSSESIAVSKYGENGITFRPHFYFGDTNQEIDFVFFLNVLPIVALELNHEKNQTYTMPWLSSPPRREQNFRWHNTGLTNTAQTPAEYPVEFLYREVLSQGTNEKLVDPVFILTDRKSLDTNIKEDIENFTHLKDVVVSDLMKQIRQTEVIKAAVEYQGEVHSGGPVLWPATQESIRPGCDRRNPREVLHQR